MPPRPLLLALLGPTAVGKSDLALRIAERVGAEVVSADSRQVYRGLDIGTAKPAPEDLVRVRHHFIDELGLDEPFSAGQFATEANARLRDILARGHQALVVGGSTLYLEALLHGLSDVPSSDPEVRATVEREASAEGGLARLYAELEAADPEAARTLDPSKSQRLVRLVELLRTSGTPPSVLWARRTPPPFRYLPLVLHLPRPALYARIEARVDAMLAAGLLEENRRLLHEAPALDTPPLKTIGYQEPRAFLRGEVSEDEMVRLLKQNSRRYAKRQLTWFRRHPEYVWLDAGDASAEGVEALWAEASRANRA